MVPGAVVMAVSDARDLWHDDAAAVAGNGALFLWVFVTFISVFVCYRVEFEGRQMFLQTLLLYHDQRQLLETQDELKALPYIDGLTQVANRRRFNQRMTEDWRRCQRAGAPLSLILL